MPAEPLNPRAGCAVVVTYHPDADFPARLERIAGQVAETVIVDNGSDAQAAAMLRHVAGAVTLIENGENLGVATALNQGARHAVERGYAWALLLDQDTLVDTDLIETLLRTRAAHPDPDRIAVMGARFRDTHGRPAEAQVIESGDDWQEVESSITSGSLLALDIHGILGPFRDDFFIDYVDTEYCLRARAAGYRIVETRRPLMSHTVGAPSNHRTPWGRRWTTNHSAERRYYIARNNTVLLREYGTGRGGSWRLKSVSRCFRLCKRIVMFEADKLSKLIAVGQGWWDAMRGRMGPRRRTHATRRDRSPPFPQQPPLP